MGPSDVPQNTLSHALDGLWQRFLPDIIERVDVLQSAAMAVSGSGLDPDRQEAAQVAAHKLAGVLGTFGLTRGTELAREVESILAGQPSLNSQARARFVAAAAALREVIQSRKPSA